MVTPLWKSIPTNQSISQTLELIDASPSPRRNNATFALTTRAQFRVICRTRALPWSTTNSRQLRSSVAKCYICLAGMAVGSRQSPPRKHNDILSRNHINRYENVVVIKSNTFARGIDHLYLINTTCSLYLSQTSSPIPTRSYLPLGIHHTSPDG